MIILRIAQQRCFGMNSNYFNYILLLILSFGFSGHASSSVLKAKFNLHFWKKQTPRSLPIETFKPMVLEFEFETNPAPNNITTQSKKLAVIGGEVNIYYVARSLSGQTPAYLNIEIKSKTPVALWCTQSPRSDYKLMPPMTCATEKEGIMMGVSLINTEYSLEDPLN